MATEIELKLNLDAKQRAVLLSHDLFRSDAVSELGLHQLGNCYYDTAQLDLKRERIALRVRSVGTKFIQTLKTRGHSVGGLTQRGEWEWDIPSSKLELALLQAPHWPLTPAQTAQLEPCFSTDFERQLWMLEWVGEHSARIEIALDKGAVSVAGSERVISIDELELELKDGDPEALQEVATYLARSVELSPSDISKAQRGYALLAQVREESEL